MYILSDMLVNFLRRNWKREKDNDVLNPLSEPMIAFNVGKNL